jgi:hypothetical protein
MDLTAAASPSIPRPTPPSTTRNNEARDAIEVDRIYLLNNLRLSIREAWHVIEPSTVYLENWHIDLIAEYLEAVTAGQIKRCSLTCRRGTLRAQPFPDSIFPHLAATRNRFKEVTATPSILVSRMARSTKSTNCCAQISRLAGVAPKNGLGSTLEHSAVIKGKKRGFPQGTVHERFTREPRHRPNNRIVGALTRVRTALAEPGDRNVDEVAAQVGGGTIC